MLDPVRFITNLSTGEMGYVVAREAKKRGFTVTLISGPTALTPPRGIHFIPIVTVKDLERALEKHFFRNDLLIMAAAVGDFIPTRRSLKKIPRQRKWQVSFKESPDLVQRMARRKGHRTVIGFSLETGHWIERSQKKRIQKKLDGIVANYYSGRHDPFGKNRVHVVLLDSGGSRVLRLSSKPKLARRLIDWALDLARTGPSKN